MRLGLYSPYKGVYKSGPKSCAGHGIGSEIGRTIEDLKSKVIKTDTTWRNEF